MEKHDNLSIIQFCYYIGYPTYILSVIFLIIKYYKYYYKSQIAYFDTFLDENEEKKKDSLNKKFLFKFFYTKCTSSNAVNIVVIMNTLSVIYSIIIYFVNDNVRENGFCATR